MKKLRIYYSVQNCGDGSAYPEFMDSRKLAEWDQKIICKYGDRWGGLGELDIVSESPITIEKVRSTIGYYLWKSIDTWWAADDRGDFESEFFPNGVPKFEARRIGTCNKYYYVFINGILHFKGRGWNRKTQRLEISDRGLIEFQKTLDNLGQHD